MFYFLLPSLGNRYNQGFFSIFYTLFSKRFILLYSGLKVLKFSKKLIIRSTNVLRVLYEFSKFSECILCV